MFLLKLLSLRTDLNHNKIKIFKPNKIHKIQFTNLNFKEFIINKDPKR